MFAREIAALRELAAWAEREGARTCAESIGSTARTDYEASRAPSGEPWAPRKADGAPALQRAAARVTFRSSGNDILQEAPDHYRFHREGTRFMAKRNVYSESSSALPTHWQLACEKALRAQIERRLDAFRP